MPGPRQDHNGVGQSDKRTRGKHDLLNALLGLEIGAGQFLRRPVPLLIDLCAGDGLPQATSVAKGWPQGRSSPALMLHHAAVTERPKHRSGHGYVWLFEDDSAWRSHRRDPYWPCTSDVLRFQITVLDKPTWPGAVTMRCGDCQVLLPAMTVPSDVGHVFVFNDPNSIATWAMTPQILNHLYGTTELVTTMSAVGANAGGVARMRAKVADQWRDQLWMPYEHTPHHHDTMIVALNGDNHRWGYIISGPTVWRDKYERAVAGAFESWHHGIRTAWAGTDSEGYHAIVNYLVPRAPITDTEGEAADA